MTARRVAVTGLGVVSALGLGRVTFASALRQGLNGIRPLDGWRDTDLRLGWGAMLPNWSAEAHFDNRETNLYDRFSQFALLAAREALADAAIDWTDDLRARAGVVTGSCLGGQSTEDAGFQRLYRDGAKRIHPLSIPRIMANAAASAISLENGLTGPSYTLSTACSSANHAIGHATWMLRQGILDVALAGGSEAPFSYGNLKAWEAMRVVAAEACRPFSRDRDGMSLGEGGAVLVLEPLEVARARGARIYGEIAGFGMSSDAHHITQPSARGAARAMQAALVDGAIEAEEIGYINAHGTGTSANDSTECAAIRTTFGSHADRIAVSSTKSMHGHALGAAGALEAAATLLALSEGFLPPTIHYREPDPECDLDVVPNEAREQDVEAALSNSFAFGGFNAVLAFRKVA